MRKGVAQLLGLEPYPNAEVTPVCEHEDDGYTYGENMKRVILLCSLCGEFYEQDK